MVRGAATVDGCLPFPQLLFVAVRDGGYSRGLCVGGVGRILRIQERAVDGAQFKARDGAAQEIGGIQKVLGRGVDADSDRLRAGSIRPQEGKRSTADGIGGEVGIQGLAT